MNVRPRPQFAPRTVHAPRHAERAPERPRGRKSHVRHETARVHLGSRRRGDDVVTTSLEAGELTHDGQRCERILRRLLPPCHCGLCFFMADPKRKPRQGDVDRDTGERRRQEEALDEALKNTFPASDPVSVEQPTTSGRAYRS